MDWTELREWASLATALALVVLTAMYLRASKVMADASRLMADETRAGRLEQFRPRLQVRFEFNRGMIFLVVENAGNEPALDVRFDFNQPLRGFQEDAITNETLFRSGAPYFPPGTRYSFAVDASPTFFHSGRALMYEIQCEYRGASGREFSDVIVLDLEPARGTVVQPESELAKLTKVVEKLEKRMSSQPPWGGIHVISEHPGEWQARWEREREQALAAGEEKAEPKRRRTRAARKPSRPGESPAAQ